ncbi:MAG TPA: sulfite exporter TauE/SafE family protein [Frankiaceae bacterium]|nr:sulfite exporter TauE/SafE family protein [Frankiaceae bacterium]
MHLDLYVTIAGLVVGFVVGMTGMGGGALMTPVLVLVFGIQPLAAVSSDLVASMIMKPVGGAVHVRRGTVHKELVRWLVLGSVPSAFCGVLLIKALGNGAGVQSIVKVSLGVALLVAVTMMIARAVLDVRQRYRQAGRVPIEPSTVNVRPLPTLAVGVLGGLVVGLTSVGSGSLIIVALLMLYPTLKAGDLVGTDLVQAVPLVASAALGHLIFGDFQFGLTASILIGSLPGVYLGARLSSSAPSWLIRRAIAIVLLASALKLLDVPTVTVGWTLLAVLVVSPFVWTRIRRTIKGQARRTIAAAAGT